MIQTVRNGLRSWMFIYVGFFAAIAMASQAERVSTASAPDMEARIPAADAPMGRQDI
mgnify:CR=1 FL=1